MNQHFLSLQYSIYGNILEITYCLQILNTSKLTTNIEKINTIFFFKLPPQAGSQRVQIVRSHRAMLNAGRPLRASYCDPRCTD